MKRPFLTVGGACCFVVSFFLLISLHEGIRVKPHENSSHNTSLPLLPLGLNSLMPVPVDNPLTSARIELGRKLFFDPSLSRGGTISCATCHDPKLAFADGRAVSIGVDGTPGHRNAPSLLNSGYLQRLFWDGRASTLEAQALTPITNSLEMGNTLPAAVETLRAREEYRILFAKAFGSEQINSERLAKALAGFERTLVAANSPFDRYMFGQTPAALSPSARRGLDLFQGKARCSLCHEGPLLTDQQFHNTGVSWTEPPRDPGLGGQTACDKDQGRFKTPSLRNVALTPPYMHNGSFATIEEVIRFYNKGGQPNPLLDRAIQPLHLTEFEMQDLAAFLRSLTCDMLPGQ